MSSTNTVPFEAVTTRSGPRTQTAWDTAREHLPFAFLVWLAHFIVTQGVAILSFRYSEERSVRIIRGTSDFVADIGSNSRAYASSLPPLEPLPGWQHWLVEPFRNWDGTWYRHIAESGYDDRLPALSAFFPLYPWLMRWGHNLTGLPVETVGWIISQLAFFGALVFISLLVTTDFNINIARWTMIAIAVFPTAFFFSAIYTESLFLFLAVTTLWAARKNDWLLAVLLCFLAVLTRSAGIMLGIPLAVLFAQQHGRDLRAWFPKVLLGLIPPLGLMIFGMVLRSNGLAFFDWQNQQWQWNRFSATPWRTFTCVTQGCEATVRQFGNSVDQFTVYPVRFDWISLAFEERFRWSYITSTEYRTLIADSQALDLMVTILAFALIIVGLKKLPLYYSAWSIVPMIVPLLAPSSVSPLMSMPRFVLPLVPLFVMAVLLIYPHKRTGIVLASFSAMLLMLYTAQFVMWYWVA
ncbi:MAG: hypothetical protein M9950_00230 [Thermomicrobiales bacterium]|nr:hypothetical protein [Thermomicrobiales bacterium]